MFSWLKGLFGRGGAADLNARDTFIKQSEALETPWAVFEITDFSEDGRIKVEFNWNNAFIKKIRSLGFQAETEEDAVQLFFYTSQMRPTELADDAVQADETPALNRVMR